MADESATGDEHERRRNAAEHLYDLAEALTVGESRWPAAVAIAATLVLHLFLPRAYRVLPGWVLPVLLSALLIPLLIATPRRSASSARWTRVGSLVLLLALGVANFVSIGLLLHLLLTAKITDGHQLVWSAISLWLTNVVVFGLAFWELDAGGPEARADTTPTRPDFFFPQNSAPDLCDPLWHPVFIDYLYVSFTNCTAFSPTDTMPLTPRVKMLMGFEAVVSLVVIALLAARAVNLLQ